MGTPKAERALRPKLGDVTSVNNRLLFFNREPEQGKDRPRVSTELMLNGNKFRTIRIEDAPSLAPGKQITTEIVTDKSIVRDKLVLQKVKTKVVETDSSSPQRRRTVLGEVTDRFTNGTLSIREVDTFPKDKGRIDHVSDKTFYDESTGETVAILNRSYDFIGLEGRALIMAGKCFYRRTEMEQDPDFKRLSIAQQTELSGNMRGIIYQRFKESMPHSRRGTRDLEQLFADSLKRNRTRRSKKSSPR